MNERARSQKIKKQDSGVFKKVNGTAQNSLQEQLLTEAMTRLKNPGYPVMKTDDAMQIQQGLGNKTLNTMVAQRHTIPKGREGVGEEDDEIQKSPDYGSLQRHSIPQGRMGTGEENEEIDGAIQRSPAFGRQNHPGSAYNRTLWGNGKRGDVQRKDGKKGAAPKAGVKNVDVKGGGAEKKVPEAKDEQAKAQAEKELSKFVGGGPYTIPNYVPDTVDPLQYGKFDASYDPAARTISANMRVKFIFPDLVVPKGNTPLEKAQAMSYEQAHKMYIINWLSQVQAAWSGRFTFKNIREPQDVWKKLNPINVKVNVKEIKLGAADQHFTIKGYFKTKGTSNVTGNKIDPSNPNPSQLEMFKGALDPSKQPNTGNKIFAGDEILRLQRNLPKIHFANSSLAIAGKYHGDLNYIADYLRQMNRPKFIIKVVGHANKTGKEDDNIKFSTTRAQIVHDKLKSLGVNNHTLSYSGIGSVGASKDGKWRKVDFNIAVDKSFTNIQDTTAHEFGHMLGLDDEYVRSGDTRKFTTQLTFMKKMLGSKNYGKNQEGKLAEERTAVLNLGSASVMEAGNEIRPYHYVTLWQALYEAASKAANQPAPPFGWQDWKVNM